MNTLIRTAQTGLGAVSSVVNATAPHVSKFASNYIKEAAPPMPKDMPAITRGFTDLVKSAQRMEFMNATVGEVALSGAVLFEVFGWFMVGEIIGRRHFIGYKGLEGADGHH
eukprot:Clim_evm34s144 gene=Clim_evmTU34s144